MYSWSHNDIKQSEKFYSYWNLERKTRLWLIFRHEIENITLHIFPLNITDKAMKHVQRLLHLIMQRFKVWNNFPTHKWQNQKVKNLLFKNNQKCLLIYANPKWYTTIPNENITNMLIIRNWAFHKQSQLPWRKTYYVMLSAIGKSITTNLSQAFSKFADLWQLSMTQLKFVDHFLAHIHLHHKIHQKQQFNHCLSGKAISSRTVRMIVMPI